MPGRPVLRLLLLALLAPLPLAAQEGGDGGRALHWREVAVEAHLDAEGRLHVRERQAMVFDGDWNGGERRFELRTGQRLRLDSLVRVDPATGSRTPLVEGDLDDVDRYDWTDDETLRWRSRAQSDPPFRDREIDYELDYVLAPVLVPTGDGGYRLSHDFAFAERPGAIDRFDVELTIDPAWSAPTGPRIREGMDRLPPGRGYVVRLPLRYVGAGAPAAVPSGGAPGWARTAAVVGALLVPLLVLLALRRRSRELERAAPLTPPDAVTPQWLESHLFAYPPEVVGTAWDRSVGEAEVAALLARLVGEGRLTSRVETDDGDPVLHLRRVAPLDSFPEHERDLLEGLFYDGAEETDTASIRRHYKSKGFDPAGKIRRALTAGLEALPGRGRVARPWAPGVAVLLAGVALTAIGAGRGGVLVAILGLVVALGAGAVALGSAMALSRRVTDRAGPAVGVVLPLTVAALLLAILAAGALEGEGRLVFYHPGTLLLLGLVVVLAGAGLLAAALARSTETAERLVFRRRLVSAREFFAHELRQPRPRLEDDWFPYLLAFGLGSHVDRWFRSFGGRTSDAHPGPAVVVGTAARGGHPGGHPGGGWTGGGPRFGGGDFGGGGAGGTWSVAAAGLASGVAAPSSGGGGGGVASSGGGGGGGW